MVLRDGRRRWYRVFMAANMAVIIAVIMAPGAGTVTAQDGEHTRRRVRVPILMYHYVSVPPEDADIYRRDLSVTPDQFADQLAWLRDNGYSAITLDDLFDALEVGAPLPPHPVVLTFDDGYADAFTNAFRLLKRFGLRGTFFVVTGWIDANTPGYLTWDQARAMAAAGMSIQSHSQTHPDLTDGCDYDCLVYQILGSVQTIEAEIGIRPRFFCYPSGRYDDAVLEILPQVGIEAAVTTVGGTRHVNERPLELARLRVRGTTTLEDFAWAVSTWSE